jgi:uncharacterized protein YbjT (DUF2867 family)
VRALVRPESPRAAPLRELGVEIATGDLRDAASVDAACRGATAVISTATAMGTKDRRLTLRAVDRDGQLRLVESARRAGVATFVYVSVSPHLGDRAPLVRYTREVERAVRGSGMRWTILQPCVFMEIWLSKALGWDHARGRAIVVGDGTAPLGWISADDVAAYAVRALDEPRLADREVQLAGPALLSPNDVRRVFERHAGRPYAMTRVPRRIPALIAPLVARLDEMVASGMWLAAEAALGDRVDASLQRELAVPLTSVEDYAARVHRG